MGATLACDGAPPTLGDVTLADGAAATESPCCSLRCSDTWYPIRGYQTNSLTTPRIGPERHALAPNATHQARMSRTWPGARCTRAASARGTVQRPVRMDGFDYRLCGHIGPHFIKSGLGADNLILGNRPWKKYEIGGDRTPRAEAARVLRAPYLPDIGTTLRPPRLPVLRVNWPEAGSTVEASSLNT